MPVYEYKCKSCSEKFDIQRSLCEEDAEVKCPKCGSADAERVYSSFVKSMLGNLKMWSRPS